MSILTRVTKRAKSGDLVTGKQLYKDCQPFDACTNEAMRSGWLLAEKEFIDWYNTEASDVETMDAALAEYRAAPVTYLSDEAMAEIEAERPGEEYCTRPWNY